MLNRSLIGCFVLSLGFASSLLADDITTHNRHQKDFTVPDDAKVFIYDKRRVYFWPTINGKVPTDADLRLQYIEWISRLVNGKDVPEFSLDEFGQLIHGEHKVGAEFYYQTGAEKFERFSHSDEARIWERILLLARPIFGEKAEIYLPPPGCAKFKFLQERKNRIAILSGSDDLLLRTTGIRSVLCHEKWLFVIADTISDFKAHPASNVSPQAIQSYGMDRLFGFYEGQLRFARRSFRGGFFRMKADAQRSVESVLRLWSFGVKEYTTLCRLDGASCWGDVYQEPPSTQQGFFEPNSIK